MTTTANKTPVSPANDLNHHVAQILRTAFLEMRLRAQSGRQDPAATQAALRRVADLADLFHNLPNVLRDSEHRRARLSVIRSQAEAYTSAYPDAPPYVHLMDNVIDAYNLANPAK